MLCYVKAIVGLKKTVTKSVPKMAVFRKFKGINIKYCYQDPQKALPYPDDVLWRILRKNPFKGALFKNRKNEEKTSRTKRHGKMTYLWSSNLWTDHYKLLHAGWCPGPNHAYQFW